MGSSESKSAQTQSAQTQFACGASFGGPSHQQESAYKRLKSKICEMNHELCKTNFHIEKALKSIDVIEQWARTHKSCVDTSTESETDMFSSAE